jgi:hypothetical protein
MPINHINTQEDIDVLDEYRTVANSGIMLPKPKDKLVELDVGKAYSCSIEQNIRDTNIQ